MYLLLGWPPQNGGVSDGFPFKLRKKERKNRYPQKKRHTQIAYWCSRSPFVLLLLATKGSCLMCPDLLNTHYGEDDDKTFVPISNPTEHPQVLGPAHSDPRNFGALRACAELKGESYFAPVEPRDTMKHEHKGGPLKAMWLCPPTWNLKRHLSIGGFPNCHFPSRRSIHRN